MTTELNSFITRNFLAFSIVFGLLFVYSFANGQWEVLGENYISDPSTHQSIAVDFDGTPYVAFKDGSAFGRASVIREVDGIWENVGDPGFSEDGFFGTDYHNIVFGPDGVPFVAFRDLNNGTKPSVMKFNGASWEYVGEPGLTAGAVNYVSLDVNSQGVPYVTFREAGLADKCSVMKFETGEWEYVGEAGFSTWNSSTAYNKIAIDSNDNVYIAYQEETYEDGASVLTWNGEEWEYVGEPGFSEGPASFVSLAISESGSLFVAYRDNSLDGKCTVRSFIDDSWQVIGEAGFTDGAASYVSLEIDVLNRAVVVYKDWSSSGRTSVMRFLDNSWEQVGEPGFSTGSANHQHLATNANGHMYVAYEVGDVEVQRFVVMGCTDEYACNYNIEATDDDGSCVNVEVFDIDGVTNPQAGTTETYTYPETAGSSYEWSVTNGTIISGQGTNTVVIEWGEIGEASLTVVETNSVDCESAPVTLDVTIPVGIEEFTAEFSIYPNPFSEVLTIATDVNNDWSIDVVDMRGKICLSEKHTGSKIIISTDHLEPGMYSVLIKGSSFSEVYNLMKQ